MPLIVEDGRCPQFANSYVSLADADAYLISRGLWQATPMVETADLSDNSEIGQNAPTQIPDAEITTAKEAALEYFDFKISYIPMI